MKKQYLKIQLQDRDNFMKYYDLRGLGLSTNEKNLLCYLVDKEPILKVREDGFIRISNDFIENYFEDWSSHIIRTTFTSLQEKGYVEISIERNSKSEKTRWIKITNKINEVTKDYSSYIYDHNNDHIKEDINNHNKEDINDHIKNFNIKQNNIITEYQNNIFQENYSSTKNKEDPAIIQYIENCTQQEILMKWYLHIGKKHRITLEQLRDKYQDLECQCRQEPWMMERSIKNAYLGNYYNFVKPINYNAQDSLHTDVLDEVRLSKEAF